MNQGIFGFPTALSNNTISTKEIDASGTYLIAPGTKRLVIFAVGAGGGGGAGGKYASGTRQSGGAGGSGGSQIYQDFNVEDLGGTNTTLSIVIGAGGVGGATAGDTAAGGVGVQGGTTSITPTGKPGTIIACLGGNPGAGGTTTVGGASGGGARTGFSYGATLTHLAGGASNQTNGSPSNMVITSINNHGGAGGGGMTSLGGPVAGGIVLMVGTGTASIATPEFSRTSTTVYSGGTSVVAAVDSYIHILGKMSPGFGGAGGGGGITGGTKGGNGYRGSGGGGGGSTLNTYTAGTGGTGGNGYVCITAIG